MGSPGRWGAFASAPAAAGGAYPGRCSRRRPRCSSGASTWCAAAGAGASCRANGSPPPAPARRPSRGGSAQAYGNATRSATGAIHQAAYASAGLRSAGRGRVVRGGSGPPCSLLAKGRQSARARLWRRRGRPRLSLADACLGLRSGFTEALRFCGEA